jgi:hypothetical protein
MQSLLDGSYLAELGAGCAGSQGGWAAAAAAAGLAGDDVGCTRTGAVIPVQGHTTGPWQCCERVL